MSWRTQANVGVAEDSYQWISAYLTTFDVDLLKFELEVDSQHFYDNINVLLVNPSPHDHRRSPLQLTRSDLNEISEFQGPVTKPDRQEATPVPSVSFCDLLNEAQIVATHRCQASGRAATTPRKSQARTIRHRTLIATAATNPYEKPATRSSSRKRLNRRLFQ